MTATGGILPAGTVYGVEPDERECWVPTPVGATRLTVEVTGGTLPDGWIKDQLRQVLVGARQRGHNVPPEWV